MSLLQQRINAFLHEARYVRQLSEHTLTAYARELANLLHALPDMPLDSISSLVLRRLIMAEKHHKATTIRRKVAAWRSFFDYLVYRQDIASNPARGIRAPSVPAPLPKALTPDEMNTLLCAHPSSDNWLLCRDKAILELFYSSALRLAELTALNMQDIQLTGQDACVHILRGKGGRGRTVPVGQLAIKALTAWLTRRTLHTPTEALFISRLGKRLSARTIQNRVALYAKRQGLCRPLSPHALRHSCASHFLQSSKNLRATQEILGHHNIASTQIYTRLDFQHLAEIYDKTHPRA